MIKPEAWALTDLGFTDDPKMPSTPTLARPSSTPIVTELKLSPLQQLLLSVMYCLFNTETLLLLLYSPKPSKTLLWF